MSNALFKGEDQKPFCRVPLSYSWSSAIQLIYFPLLKQATALGAFIIVPASCLKSIYCCHLLQTVLHLPTHGTLYGDRNNGKSLAGLKCSAQKKFRFGKNYLHYFFLEVIPLFILSLRSHTRNYASIIVGISFSCSSEKRHNLKTLKEFLLNLMLVSL
jgi:hypothetical protein